MTSLICVEKMIKLTNKKIEALAYLLTTLEENKARRDLAYKKWYYNRKRKIEQAILKIDVEFLDAYQHLLSNEGVHTIGDLPKGKFTVLQELQALISQTKCIEEEINKAEKGLLEMNDEQGGSFNQKPSKHTAPRAIEAYKKFKK